MNRMKIAFYDIGTNSIHMKIVEIHDRSSFEVIEHERDMTRIGDGSFRSRRLTGRAMKRALAVLGRFSRIAKKEGVRSHVVIATSAVRDAKNGRDFVRAVRKKTGLRVRVISGEEEGRLIFLGACSSLERRRGRMLSIDIGGGSAEFVLGDRRRIDCATSLRLGVTRLKDRFFEKDPPSKRELSQLKKYVDYKLEEVGARMGKKNFSTVIGTAGTMINLASMIYEEKESRRLRLRGFFELKKSDIKRLAKRLSRLSVKRIRKIHGLDKKRADIVTAGAVLVSAMMEALECECILISDKGIREGLILDFMMRRTLRFKRPRPCLPVQWFGQKPFFSGKILA